MAYPKEWVIVSSFSFDRRDFERVVRQAADEAVRQRANALQGLVDALGRTHEGRPVDEVKVALRTGWQSATGDGDITDPELAEWATYISQGRNIHIQYDGLN